MTDFEVEDRVRAAVAPTVEAIHGARVASNAEIAGEWLGGAGSRVLDVGCGDGKFTRVLATLFAKVDGIDVNAAKIEQAQANLAGTGSAIAFRAGSAENLPYPDRSFDVVVFSNSLHHIPDMRGALRQAARVLVSGGLLYVMEPVPAGSYFEAMKLLEDETAVRTAAYRAIGEALAYGFTAVGEVMYRSRRQFADYAEWCREQSDRSEARRVFLQQHGDEARRGFDEKAEIHDGRPWLEQVYRVNLLRRIA